MGREKRKQRRQRQIGDTEKGQGTNTEGRIKICTEVEQDRGQETKREKRRRLNDRQTQKPRDTEANTQEEKNKKQAGHHRGALTLLGG